MKDYSGSIHAQPRGFRLNQGDYLHLRVNGQLEKTFGQLSQRLAVKP